jgi:hypothetical protein
LSWYQSVLVPICPGAKVSRIVGLWRCNATFNNISVISWGQFYWCHNWCDNCVGKILITWLKFKKIEVLKELSISPGVPVYYTNQVTLRKVWILNKQRKTSGI